MRYSIDRYAKNKTRGERWELGEPDKDGVVATFYNREFLVDVGAFLLGRGDSVETYDEPLLKEILHASIQVK